MKHDNPSICTYKVNQGVIDMEGALILFTETSGWLLLVMGLGFVHLSLETWMAQRRQGTREGEKKEEQKD